MKYIHLITHHWSDNYLKGYHIYNDLDKVLGYLKNIKLTFIGKYNKKYSHKNIKVISPKSGEKLANIIRTGDIYITASQNEPCGMHHIEGMSCGLPIVYCKGGGAIKEVIDGCGEEYTDIKSLLVSIEKIVKNYDKYKNKINYKLIGSERCCEEYYKIISNLI